MFTGIVQETGKVRDIQRRKTSIRLTVEAKAAAKGVKLGDSVAVNGCCLTVVSKSRSGKGTLLGFDLLSETWNRTNLKALKPGGLVNLEGAMRAGSQFGGHFVSGHIDGVGRITRWERSGQDHVLEIEAPTDILPYLVFKGSIAVDGISLTVAEVTARGFRIWIIPHTYEVTVLRQRSVGDEVNLEADLLAKYVERIIATRTPEKRRSESRPQRNSKGPRN